MAPVALMWAAALCCVGAMTIAQAAGPLSPQHPARGDEVAAGSFDRGTPVPPWVRRVSPPPTSRSEAIVARLVDHQLRVGNDPAMSMYVEAAAQANAPAALAQAGQVSFIYMPQYERVHLHSIGIWRDGVFIDRTASADVRFLERETGLERGVYDGAVTVVILLADIRVGDTVHYAVTIEGSNPVFGTAFAATLAWELTDPVELRRVILTHPRERQLQWRLDSDFRERPIAPRISDDGGLRTLVFEERRLEPLQPEPAVPDAFLLASQLQFSEYRDWNEVARWAQSLFAPESTASDELTALTTQCAAQPDAAARAAAALHWVQSEVRNLSLSFGESSHRPQAPVVVLQRRFGDCKDKVHLLTTMLRAIGIEATPVLVSLQTPRLPGRLLPNPGVFDHAIVRARIDGKDVYLDPTDPPEPVTVGARWPVPPLTLGLPADPRTRDLVAVGVPPRAAAAGLEVQDHIRIPALGAAATIETRVTYSGRARERDTPALGAGQPRTAARHRHGLRRTALRRHRVAG